MHCYIQNKEAVGLVVLVFPIVRQWDPMTFEVGRFGPQGHVFYASIRVLLDIAIYTKHISCGSRGLREDDFLNFKSMEGIALQGVASLDARGLTGRIYVLGTLLYTKHMS